MIVKQVDLRANIKKYLDIAHSGDTIIVPRKDNKNIVIISEEEYNRLSRFNRLSSYTDVIPHREPQKVQPASSGDIRSDNLNKLLMISGLKDNWNGNGAPSFSDKVIKKTEKLIMGLSIQPEIFPTALGTIQFEYDNSRRDHIEIEISEDNTAEIFTVTYDGKEFFENIPSTVTAINEKVAAFYG